MEVKDEMLASWSESKIKGIIIINLFNNRGFRWASREIITKYCRDIFFSTVIGCKDFFQ